MNPTHRIRQPQTYVLNGVEQSGVLAVPLQKGQFMLIDEQDWPLLSHANWCFISGRKSGTLYAQESCHNGKLAHRVIMDAKKGEFVDHRNGNGLDNRRSNLRISTLAENNRNVGLNRRNSSGFKGVCIDRGRIRARITVDNKRIHVGFFPSPIEAAKAYDKAAQFYHGEFARLNFPTDPLTPTPYMKGDLY